MSETAATEEIPDEVTVVAPARLHFGFIHLSKRKGYQFGSIGVGIKDIANKFSFARADKFAITVDKEAYFGECLVYENDKIEEKVRAYCKRLDVPANMHIHIRRAIPTHQGLGSGTQLALTLGHGINRLYGLHADSYEIAQAFGRGARSGIGIATFENGGFIVDGGKDDSDAPPRVVERREWDEAWRIVLVIDCAMRGLYGGSERQAFSELPEQSQAEAQHLEDLVFAHIVPALDAHDFDAVAGAIAEIQRTMGEYFKMAQKGHYTSKVVQTALKAANVIGQVGIGQSSWGSTGFVLCQSSERANEVKRAIEDEIGDKPSLMVRCVSVANNGQQGGRRGG